MKRAPLLLPFLLTACATQADNIQTYFLNKKLQATQTAEVFQHCQAYGCKIVKPITLPQEEWREIKALFQPTPRTPAEERTILSKALGDLETRVGAKTGTDKDEAGTFRQLGDDQLDCVDESTNSTVYLMALKDKGLLTFHTIEPPTMRLPLIHAGHWPHQTAVIRDNTTGKRFAVDSWFRDNGAPADIVPLKLWKDGWKPENTGESWL